MTPALEIEGNDLVVRNVRATCFGGTNDPQDSGETASGISTKPSWTIGVALPRKYTGSDKATRDALEDGIIPSSVPFTICVEVTDRETGRKWVGAFIDLGPATWTGNYIDLTVAMAKKFNPNASATNFSMMCDYRILGGAEYV